jgi:predicted glutamine amidotransferase
MCRWLAYAGPTIHPEDFLFEPENSLIDQSMAAQLGTTPTNGDGFGLGWYGERDAPGLFRDVHPAWNDDNLKSVAEQVSSPLFFAHVRASTTGGISRYNCHPFRYGNWLFMHNGQIGGYDDIRHRIDSLIAPEFYNSRMGATDSESTFLILLSNGLQENPKAAFEKTVALVRAAMKEAGITAPLRLTAVASDGNAIYALRYSSDEHAPSLYLGGEGGDALTVLSEPLTSVHEDWREVPPSSFVTIRDGSVKEEPFALDDRLAAE